MSQISLIRIAVLGLTLAWPALPVSAQTAPAGDEKPAQAVAGAGECPPAATQAEPATPETASADGTAPANSGSTGWTGGTGGSLIGTNPSGANHATKTWQPATARGLDLAGRPEPAPAC
ncbi:hypothetical protein NM680_03125 [Paracoccus sp. PS-1]|uniref:hypothetical protein n=1 Tax=unclassified Paracoccus (in: a-proteobacteria) TaxID=2688777 RepID=UPI000490B5CA|nr:MULTISPECIES: hypothetical protein [unclassified Paracoccus (in: a-proteobacteria)]MDQ7260789.1 hypothetical protein [Paracoccus sp. PS1]RQP03952.1 MAG: hypothetical protein D1H97_20515 [Paracoccus sp. BP8]RQP06166.1 MAG: hypothetical protein D1H97_09080 [Paracoccus sp. BP8]UFM65751.1 hypothetical protein LOS78_07255 [Paracoccus sp. MA]